MKKIYSNRLDFALIFISSVLIFSINFHYLLAEKYGMVHPWNTFLFDPTHRFTDWIHSVIHSKYLNPYNMPAPSIAAYFPLFYLTVSKLISTDLKLALHQYFYISIILHLVLIYKIKTSKKINFDKSNINLLKITFIIFFSYPVIFSIDRGNIDIWIFYLIAIGFIFYKEQNNKTSLLIFAIASSLKGYPIAFILYFIFKKQYSFALYLILLFLLFVIVPLLIFEGGFFDNLQLFMHNLAGYKKIYVIGSGSLFASSDPYNMIRIIVLYLYRNLFEIKLNVELMSTYIYMPYLISNIALMMYCCYYLYRKKINSDMVIMTFISFVVITFPNVANDYKLCILLLPLLFSLINLIKPLPFSIYILILLLLVPKSFYFIQDRSISMVINPILIVLSYILLFNHIKINKNKLHEF